MTTCAFVVKQRVVFFIIYQQRVKVHFFHCPFFFCFRVEALTLCGRRFFERHSRDALSSWKFNEKPLALFFELTFFSLGSLVYWNNKSVWESMLKVTSLNSDFSTKKFASNLKVDPNPFFSIHLLSLIEVLFAKNIQIIKKNDFMVDANKIWSDFHENSQIYL